MGRYEARFDLDSDGTIGFGDFLIFGKDFGKEVSAPGGSGGGSPGIVDIPDANLRAVIADSLGKASGAPITRAEMATLTRIEAPNKGIRDLTGLEHATNLQWLRLGGVTVNNEWVNSNDISNLSPLSDLMNLTRLDLQYNAVSDLTPLSGMPSLRDLFLAGNSFSDIAPLSDLTNLTVLDLQVNGISDITLLSDLTNLIELYLQHNSISDISVLSNLTNLRVLSLYNNSISDISPLVANTGLGSGDEVNLRSNPLSSTSINTHIPALQRRGVDISFDPTTSKQRPNTSKHP